MRQAALLTLTLVGLGLCGATSACRESSRRDTVVTRPSASASSNAASSAPAIVDPASAGDANPAIAPLADAALAPGTVAYGSATLTGKLVEENFFGPPGFGSDPTHDKKEPVLVLQLAQPIDVVLAPDAGSELDIERMGVVKVSLTDPKDPGVDLHKFLGQRITVAGTLFGAHTAHHHTDVLMSGVEIVPQ